MQQLDWINIAALVLKGRHKTREQSDATTTQKPRFWWSARELVSRPNVARVSTGSVGVAPPRGWRSMKLSVGVLVAFRGDVRDE